MMQNAGPNAEGPLTDRTGEVEYVHALESPTRLAVGLRPFAQLFVAYASDPDFTQHSRILQEARNSKAVVRLTVREYSGRVVYVSRPSAASPTVNGVAQ